MMNKWTCLLLITIALLFFNNLRSSQGQYGTQTISVEHPAAVSVGTGSTVVLAAKDDRRLLILINNSDTAIWCSLNSTAAVVGRGILLSANGGNLFMDATTPSGAVNCISSGSSKSLAATQG